MDELHEDPISRTALQRKLERASNVRFNIVMVSLVPGIPFAVWVWKGREPTTEAEHVLAFGTAVALCFLVSFLVTEFYCRGKVKCHRCHESLWDCGRFSHNLQSLGTMQVREDATECPHCRTPIY